MKKLKALIPQIEFEEIEFEVSDDIDLSTMSIKQKANLIHANLTSQQDDWLPYGKRSITEALEERFIYIKEV